MTDDRKPSERALEDRIGLDDDTVMVETAAGRLTRLPRSSHQTASKRPSRAYGYDRPGRPVEPRRSDPRGR